MLDNDSTHAVQAESRRDIVTTMKHLGIADLVTAGSRLTGRPLGLVRELTGGQHALTVLAGDSAELYVVRAFPPGDPAVRNELAVLEKLTPLGELAPRLIAHGEASGHPVIVTSALPGGHPAPDLPLAVIAEQMATALAAIHQLDGSGLPEEPGEPAPRDDALAQRAHAEWRRLTLDSRVLTHLDFWCGNALWEGDRLVGVVDWSCARSAPRGVDVAWCRQDLVLLGSAEAADIFLRSYESRSGQTISDIQAWDVLAAAHAGPHVESWDVNYRGIGRPEITGAVLRERLDEWIDTLLR